MRRWLFVFTGVLAYLLFLLISLPLPYAINLLASHGLPLAVVQSSGSVWSGESTLISYDNIALGPAKWRFNPSGLLRGQLKYWLELNNSEHILSGYLAKDILSDGISLSGIKGQFPVNTLLELTGQTSIGALGQLDVDLPAMRIAHQQIISAEGELHWLDAGVEHPVKVELGNLQFILSGDEKIFKSDINEIDGPLKIDGEFSLYPDGGYRLQGKVIPGNAANQGLVSLLQSIGRVTADGTIQIDYSGRF